MSTGDSSFGVNEMTLTRCVAKMDHLACFVPGVFALDALFGNKTPAQNFSYGLAKTCYRMYNRRPTFLAPEISVLSKSEILDDRGSMHNLLRPETIESLFLLSVQAYKEGNATQITLENWGWDIFMAFQRSSRVRYGYSSIEDVTTGVHMDHTPSYFFSETLKYAYLLFEDKEKAYALLDSFLLTTEAHFVPRSERRCSSILAKKRFEKLCRLSLFGML